MKFRVDVIYTLRKQITVEAESREDAEAEAIEAADGEGWDITYDFNRTDIGGIINVDRENAQ